MEDYRQLYEEALYLESSKSEWCEQYYSCEYADSYDIMNRLADFEAEIGNTEDAKEIQQWIEKAHELEDNMYYGDGKSATDNELKISEDTFDKLLHMAIEHLSDEI